MSETTDRLARLITEREGGCCPADVDDRIAALREGFDVTAAATAADVPALRTLGDDTRYRITRLLVATEGELCVCEITPLFDVSDSAVSHALSDLVDAGLLARRKDGTWRYYAATDRARALMAALDDTRAADR